MMEIHCTAWDCCGEHYRHLETHNIVTSRTFYEDAYVSGSLVCLQRLETVGDMKLRVVRRYVHPDYPVTLQPLPTTR
jgi:hypothetical protein